MKSLLIAIKPKWCALMMNGDKTVEVRTSKTLATAIQKLIDEYGYADIYVYCSKDGGNLVYGTEYRGGNFVDEYGITRGYSKQKANEIFGLLNSKVLFKFRCYKVEEYPYISGEYDKLIGSCLSEKELLDYSTIKFENGIRFVKTIYAIHISNLEIFDKPKELSEFSNCDKYPYTKYIGKAPQNFCYVEV